MASSTYGGRGRTWHPDFLEYMDQIVDHPNYAGLPCTRDDEGKIDWTIPSNRTPGSKNWDGNSQRREWWRSKAGAIGLSTHGHWLSQTARTIHPFKKKPCQTCGRWMSVEYVYPTNRTLELFRRKLPNIILPERSVLPSIDEVIDAIIEQCSESEALAALTAAFPLTAGTESIADFRAKLRSEYVAVNSRLLSPGAMSNAPDRLDGFHTYNLCCRTKQDTGRARENLARYGSDRRAYEQWAEGDWSVADLIMSSTGRGICSNPNCVNAGSEVPLTADHIGPISLGFRHSTNFTPLCTECNSAKNNRMSLTDVRNLIDLELTGESAASWQASRIWNACKSDVKSDSDALTLSKILRINQDAYIRFLAAGALSPHPEALMQFLDLSPALSRVFLVDFNPATLELGGVTRETRQPKYSFSRAARIIRISFQALRDYGAGARNIQLVEPAQVSHELAEYEATLALERDSNALLQALREVLSRFEPSSAFEEELQAVVASSKIVDFRITARNDFNDVGTSLRRLMVRHQDVLIERFTRGDHRGESFTDLMWNV